MSGSGAIPRLKVLFLSESFVYPPDTGGKIRTSQMLRHLQEIFDITLVSHVDPIQDAPHIGEMKALCSEFHPVLRRRVAKYSTAFYLRTLMRSFSREPIIVRNDYSRTTVAKLRELLTAGHYDLLVCDFLQPTINLWGLPLPRTLLFQHNVESMIWERHYRTCTNRALRIFWRQQWRKLLRYERLACARVDGTVTVSEADKAILERDFGARNVFAIPTGVDGDFFRPDPGPPEDNTLVFVGAMDWLPNEDGVIFFAEQVLPRLRAMVPGIRLTVVGRNPSGRLASRLRAHPEIQIVGRVPDIRPFVNRSAVFVIPLRVGGGTRIKAYEAMAMGKAVVSTRIGVEGLPVLDGENVALADDPQAFAMVTARLLTDPVERARLARNARAYVEEHVSWRRASIRFAEVCATIARGERA